MNCWRCESTIDSFQCLIAAQDSSAATIWHASAAPPCSHLVGCFTVHSCLELFSKNPSRPRQRACGLQNIERGLGRRRGVGEPMMFVVMQALFGLPPVEFNAIEGVQQRVALLI